MKRIQVLLEPETIKAVKKAAKDRNTSASGYIRNVVEEKVEKETEKKVDATRILLKAAKNAFKGGPKDLSMNDEYLYGEDSEK